jgi:hypothetical protein
MKKMFLRSSIVSLLQHQPNVISTLLEIIERSKTDKSISVAAGNSVTLLIKLGHSFKKSDLTYTYLKNASLDGGDFSEANFSNGILENCSLNSINIFETKFHETKFLNCHCEERASFTYKFCGALKCIEGIRMLKNFPIIIAKCENGIVLWKNNEEIQITSKLSSIRISPNEEWMIFFTEDEVSIYETSTCRKVLPTFKMFHCAEVLLHNEFCVIFQNTSISYLLLIAKAPKKIKFMET